MKHIKLEVTIGVDDDISDDDIQQLVDNVQGALEHQRQEGSLSLNFEDEVSVNYIAKVLLDETS